MACTAALHTETAGACGSNARAVVRAVRRRLGAVLCLAVAMLLAAGPSPSAAEPVRGDVALSASGGYARLLLKFDEEVQTEVVVAGAILVVRFKKPVDLAVDKLSDAVPAYVGSARRDPDGMAIRMALAQKVRVNVMAAGERVFVDLLPESWTGLPPQLPPEVVRELTERALTAERALRMQRAADEVKKKPPVRVRTSVQPTFVRFVFELPDGIGVSSSLNAEKFSLSFASALTFDLADAKIAAPSNVKSIDQKIDGDRSSVDIALIGEVDVHSFREDQNYIVDVGFDQPQKPAAKLPLSKASPGPAKSEAGRADPAAPTSESIAHEAKIEIKPQAGAGEPKPQEAKQEVKPDARSEIKPAEQPVVAGQPSAEPGAKLASAVEQKAKPSVPVAQIVEALPPAAETPRKAVPVANVPPAAGNGAALVVEAKRTTDEFRLTFAFGEPTPSAVFRRADAVWMVFASDKQLDLKAVRREGGSLVADVTAIDLPKGRAMRIKLNRPQLVSLTGDERTVVLSLTDKSESASQQLVASRDITDAQKANLSIALANPGPALRFTDPDAGDALIVVTAPLPARGFIRRQNFVEFSLLESIHGVVIQPNSDDIATTLTANSIVLSRPGGLTLSSSNASPQRASVVVGPAFDIREWQDNQKSNFNRRLDELTRSVAAATSDDRAPAYLALARFYIARGFYQEARGVLNLARDNAKTEESEPALIARSIADTLSGRPAQGLKDIATPAAGNSLDAQLWRGLASARLEKWADAREKFKNAETAIVALPLDLQRIVMLGSMRASLEVRDYSGATARGNEIGIVGVLPEQKSAFALLRGRLAEALGQDRDALTYFREAADSLDRPVAAKARLYEIALRQKRNEIGEDEALHALETLAVTWRGDDTEVRCLQMLSRIYGEKDRYSDAFAAARIVSKLQPNSDISRSVQDEAASLFSQIYLSTKGDSLPPVEALAMFYEYQNLAPIGRRGDEMIRRLSDRLVAFDLLDQAGELLQYQVDHRLEGAARAQVAARLAMIYLMNRKPSRAIGALRTTRIADLAGELRQQRLLLEARAQSDIGRHDLALDIISNVTGREAIRLRSDIYWAARRWRESSEQIELLYGERWRDFQPLTVLEKSDVIRATIGYALAEDVIGLARFREKYAPKMDSASDRSAFAIASKPASANSADFARIAKMAAAIDTLDGFLREMKTRFPDAVARAKLPPEIKVDMNPTGALPAIVGVKTVETVR